MHTNRISGALHTKFAHTNAFINIQFTRHTCTKHPFNTLNSIQFYSIRRSFIVSNTSEHTQTHIASEQTRLAARYSYNFIHFIPFYAHSYTHFQDGRLNTANNVVAAPTTKTILSTQKRYTAKRTEPNGNATAQRPTSSYLLSSHAKATTNKNKRQPPPETLVTYLVCRLFRLLCVVLKPHFYCVWIVDRLLERKIHRKTLDTVNFPSSPV